jgi:NAD(P)H dehydrogenase (quinone)
VRLRKVIMAAPGHTDPVRFETGNPYGSSHVSGQGAAPGEDILRSACHRGRRAVDLAAVLRTARAAR